MYYAYIALIIVTPTLRQRLDLVQNEAARILLGTLCGQMFLIIGQVVQMFRRAYKHHG